MKLGVFELHKVGLHWETVDLGVQDTPSSERPFDELGTVRLGDMLLDSFKQASQLQEDCTGM